MAPPKFDDLGKAANDLFKKGFEHGNVKLEVKTKAENMDFTCKGAHNLAKSSMTASLETNMKNVYSGFDLKKTVHTNGSTDLELSRLIEGAGKATFCAGLNNAGSGFTAQKFKQAYTKSNLNINFASTLTAKPTVNLDAVFNFNNVNAGFAASFDTNNMKLKSNTLGLNFSQNNIDATVKSNLKNDLNLVVHSKCSNTCQTAAMVNYDGNVSLGLAGKVTGCPHGSTNYKIDNNGLLAASYVTKFDSGCELTFSGNFDCKNLQSGGHTLGAMFKFDL